MRGTIVASMHRTWMELRDELNEAVDVSGRSLEYYFVRTLVFLLGTVEVFRPGCQQRNRMC